MKKLLLSITAITVVVIITGCSNDPKKPGYELTAATDMYRSPSYETYSKNPNFTDSSTARRPVEGTIARGNSVYASIDRIPYPYPNSNEGYEAAGVGLKNPVEKSDANLMEGKKNYEDFCLVCHGASGAGDGPVVQRNGPRPPAFSSDQLKNLPEGKMFHSIHYGKNMMGAHASQLTATERWKIVMYVQTLQASGNTSMAATN